jgi:hypothetical protein
MTSRKPSFVEAHPELAAQAFDSDPSTTSAYRKKFEGIYELHTSASCRC